MGAFEEVQVYVHVGPQERVMGLSGLAFAGLGDGSGRGVHEERMRLGAVYHFSGALVEAIGGGGSASEPARTVVRLAGKLVEAGVEGLFYDFLAKQLAMHLQKSLDVDRRPLG